jgi:hypothetical protein
MQSYFTAFIFLALAFVGFIIYFIFKQMQFVIRAVDLYKDMVTRLDKIVELLSAGSAPSTNISPLLSQNPAPAAAGAAPEAATPLLEAAPAQAGPTCSSCGAAVQTTDVFCESCGARLDA